jgi:hypothetical protein
MYVADRNFALSRADFLKISEREEKEGAGGERERED